MKNSTVIGEGEAEDPDLHLFDEAVEGFHSSIYYSSTEDTAENKAFLAALKAKFGPDALPSTFTVGAYDSLGVIAMLLEKQAGQALSGLKEMELIKGYTWASPRGKVTLDPVSREPIEDFMIREVKPIKGGRLSQRDYRHLPADQPRHLRHGRLNAFAVEKRQACKSFLSTCAFIGLYGASYGFVLFTISIGLVVTMGLMRVVNLAHGAFAAIGGYATIALMHSGVSYGLAVICAVGLVAAIGVVLERVIFVHLYGAADLDQVLMTLGVNFIVIAALTLLFGPNLFPMTLPGFLRGDVDFGFRTFEVYRVFIVIVGATLAALIYLVFERTNFGARLRAAVDNRTMAEAIGIDVGRLFSISFAIGRRPGRARRRHWRGNASAGAVLSAKISRPGAHHRGFVGGGAMCGRRSPPRFSSGWSTPPDGSCCRNSGASSFIFSSSSSSSGAAMAYWGGEPRDDRYSRVARARARPVSMGRSRTAGRRRRGLLSLPRLSRVRRLGAHDGAVHGVARPDHRLRRRADAGPRRVLRRRRLCLRV